MMLFVLYSDGGSDSSVSDGLPAHLQYIVYNMMLFVLYSDGGSDSSVSDGLPAHLQYIAQKVSDFIQAENYQLCLDMYSYLRTYEIQ